MNVFMRQRALFSGVITSGSRVLPIRAPLFLAVSLLVPLPALAALSAGDPFPVSAQVERSTSTTDVAIRGDGSFVIVWDRLGETGPLAYDVEARRFSPGGSPVGDPLAVANDIGGHQSSPSVAVGRSGRFLIAWQGESADDPSGVHARLFERNGTAVGDAFLLHSPTQFQGESAPSVARDGDGFVVAWIDFDGVRVVRLDANAQPRGGFSRDVEGVRLVAVDSLPGDRLVLTWSSIRYRSFTQDSEGDVGHVDGVLLSASNEVIHSFWANEREEAGSYNYVVDGELRLSVAGSGSGLFATAYDSAVPRYVYNVDAHYGGFPLGAKIERFDGSVATLGSYFLDNVAGGGRTADVAMTPGGNSVAAIEGERLGVRAIDCHGLVVGDDLLYASGEDADAVAAPSIAINELGDGVVVWAQEQPGTDGVFARRIHLDGGCALCGDADKDGRVTAIDGLLALRTAVGAGSCAMDRCDTDGSSRIGARDALRILRFAVSDGSVPLPCSGAPEIERSASAPVPHSPGYYIGHAPLALTADGGDAVLAWSPSGEPSANTVAQRIDGNLAFGPAEQIAGPDAGLFHRDLAVCSGEIGPAFAWTSGLRELPPGITLDRANVMVGLPDAPAFQANSSTIGSQRLPSIACLDGGGYSISWLSACDAVERKGYDLHFRPDECDNEPTDGAYVQVFRSDGSPVADASLVTEGHFLPPAIAAIDGDRFVVTAGDTIQVRSSAGEILGQRTAVMDPWFPTMSCTGSRCARTSAGSVVLFDADNLENLEQIAIQPRMQLGPERTIYPNLDSVACDASGTCVSVWLMEDWTSISDYVLAERPGVYARPFDLDTGEMGEAIRLQSPNFSTTEVLVTAIAPGTFVAVVDAGYDPTWVHRIDVK